MRNRTAVEIDLTLIRHGETLANREHRYLGLTDESLSPDGIQQMQERKEKQAESSLNLLFVSPMTRCKESAGILYETQPQIVIPEWREMNFGQYEMKNYYDLQGDPYYQKWIDSNGELPFPDGESRADFIARCQKGWEKAIPMILKEEKAQLGQKDQVKRNEQSTSLIHVAAVVHGGTIMALMSLFTNGSYFDYQTKNGCGYHLRLEVPIRKNHMEYEMQPVTIRYMEELI